MKKALHNLRSKSAEVRTMVALAAAFVLTAVIAGLWWGTFSSTGTIQQKTVAPSPSEAIVGSIKDAFSQPKSTTRDVEIINADTNTSMQTNSIDDTHDESNPYQPAP